VKTPSATSSAPDTAAARLGEADSQVRKRPRVIATSSAKMAVTMTMLPSDCRMNAPAPYHGLPVSAAQWKSLLNKGYGRPMRKPPMRAPSVTTRAVGWPAKMSGSVPRAARPR
jgi:hypothetical protein